MFNCFIAEMSMQEQNRAQNVCLKVFILVADPLVVLMFHGDSIQTIIIFPKTRKQNICPVSVNFIDTRFKETGTDLKGHMLR